MISEKDVFSNHWNYVKQVMANLSARGATSCSIDVTDWDKVYLDHVLQQLEDAGYIAFVADQSFVYECFTLYIQGI